MFEDLKKNLEQEKKIISDMNSIYIGMQDDATNQPLYISSLNSLLRQLILLNKSVPNLLEEWSPVRKLDEKPDGLSNNANKVKKPKVKLSKDEKKNSVVKVGYVSPSTKEKKYMTIKKGDKKEFLKKLKLSEGSFKNLKNLKSENSVNKVQKPSIIAKFSNKLFRKYSEKLAPKFVDLTNDLKKGNIRFLTSTYLSIAILFLVTAFFLGSLIFGSLIIYNLSNWIYFWIPFALVFFVAMVFYFYPSSEAGSVQKKISQELPFSTIHMAAIAGSNIEPTKIFKIIAGSKEYPNVGDEVRKVISQVDIYGYDLVTSLKNVAGRTSNKKLAELLSGLATNISTGGGLKGYLEKKAENFLLDYRLERQKYSDLAGTFMDVYISILIAAPLVLMMMFIVMNVAGLGMGGLSITELLALSIAGIVVVNIIFLFVLNLKQPAV